MDVEDREDGGAYCAYSSILSAHESSVSALLTVLLKYSRGHVVVLYDLSSNDFYSVADCSELKATVSCRSNHDSVMSEATPATIR